MEGQLRSNLATFFCANSEETLAIQSLTSVTINRLLFFDQQSHDHCNNLLKALILKQIS